MPDDNTSVGEQGGEKVVPLHVYIGVKDKLAKREAELADVRSELGTVQGRVVTLERERESGFVPKAEHKKVADELAALKSAEEARVAQTVATRREALVKSHGFTAEELKDYTSEQLDLIEKGLGKVSKPAVDGSKPTPKPDVGGGGGSPSTGSAMDKIKQGWDHVHPND